MLRLAGSPNSQLSLTVPVPVARLLQEKVGKPFACELTDEGILFRPVDVDDDPEPPPWLRAT